MSKRAAVVQLEGVSRVFHTDEMTTYALNGITMSVHAGEFVVIAGPSGCGKSTLLAVMGLLELPSSGCCRIHGQEVSALSLRNRARVRNREIGFIFQNFNLIGDMTVYENIVLPLSYRGLPRAEKRDLAMTALERVGLQNRSGHFPSQLSGGQQQRVAVARAVAGRPDIVLADEPTGNLDSRTGEAVMNLLEDLHSNDNAAICLVTHDPRYAAIAQRTIHLLDGSIDESSTVNPVSGPSGIK